MQSPDHDKLLYLVRAAPGSAAAGRALADVRRNPGEQRRPPSVFFHGPGVLHARGESARAWASVADQERVHLMVCSTAWQRRGDGPITAPFELSTLVQFWRLALAGAAISCYGSGDEE